MSIIATVEFPLQPGKRDEFVDLLVEALKATRDYEGNESVETLVEHGGTSVLLVEKWQTEDHHKAYHQWRLDTGLGELIGPFVSGPPIIRYFDPNSA